MDDETLSVNLSILSKLEISEKLDTKKSLFQIHGNSFIPEFILRFIMGSSRHSDFARIRSLYSQAISHIEDPRMADHIEASLKGLRNLRITYQEDTTLLSRIDCLIQQVTDKLNANQQNSAKKQHYLQTPAPTPEMNPIQQHPSPTVLLPELLLPEAAVSSSKQSSQSSEDDL
mgnify:CR=1 FL=1